LARPDDGQDDSAAIQRAITANVGTGRILYFPAGVYDIHQPLAARGADGKWRARLTIQGESRDKTILRLADHAAGFSDPTHPRAILSTGSIEQPGDSPDGGGNKAFGNYVLNLTIDTGSGNAGAVGIDWAVSNFGAIEEVTVRSGDGGGTAGISITRRIPGPGLIRHVAIDGFNVGIDVADIQYGITMEDLTLRHQKLAGIRNNRNLLQIHDLTSINRGPAILARGSESVLTLIGASLSGGMKDHAAIESQGSVLIRDVQTQGYGPVAVRCRGQEVAGPDIAQWVWPEPIGASEAAHGQSTALLPIRQPPECWEPDLSQWQPVGPRQGQEPDDTAAIQRAIDSGKPVVYFPNNRTYFLGDTVIVRGAVRQLLGMGSEISLGAAKEPFSDVEHPRPLLRIDPGKPEALFIEHLFFNAQYPGEVIFENNSPATLVIRHCAGWVGAKGHRHSYRNTAQATGPLFVDDVFLPGWHFTGQSVWARQFNPENPDGDGIEPQVLNEGGRLWILGFKTEGPAPFIATTRHGITELLGAYNYLSATQAPQVPAGAIPYLIDHATAALSFVTDNFRDSDYNVYIQAGPGQGDSWPASKLPPRNGQPGDRSRAVSLYRHP
jgi:hypothetical protein